MSKAILVIDKPKRCGDCELLEQYFSEENEEWYEKCIANHRMYIVDTEKIHERCPLKPMGLKTRTSGYVLYSTEYLKKYLDREYELWKELKKYNFGKADKE